MPFFNLLTGILTKPDLVDKGTEKMIVNVMQNLTYRLKKGYMIVRCRGQQEVTDRLSLAEATRKEMMFFQTHPYFRWDSLRQPCNWARGAASAICRLRTGRQPRCAGGFQDAEQPAAVVISALNSLGYLSKSFLSWILMVAFYRT